MWEWNGATAILCGQHRTKQTCTKHRIPHNFFFFVLISILVSFFSASVLVYCIRRCDGWWLLVNISCFFIRKYDRTINKNVCKNFSIEWKRASKQEFTPSTDSHRFRCGLFYLYVCGGSHRWYTVHGINSITVRWPPGMKEQTFFAPVLAGAAKTFYSLLEVHRYIVYLFAFFFLLPYFDFHSDDMRNACTFEWFFFFTSFCFSFCWPPKSIDFNGR